MSARGPLHTEVVHRVMELLVGRVSGRARLRIEGRLALCDAGPAPDLALVAPIDYADEHPGAAYLVVDVVDEPGAGEREPGRHDAGKHDDRPALYAAGDIPEYWRIHLGERSIDVHTEPAAGIYRAITTKPRGALISLVEFPDIRIAVDDIL